MSIRRAKQRAAQEAAEARRVGKEGGSAGEVEDLQEGALNGGARWPGVRSRVMTAGDGSGRWRRVMAAVAHTCPVAREVRLGGAAITLNRRRFLHSHPLPIKTSYYLLNPLPRFGY